MQMHWLYILVKILHDALLSKVKYFVHHSFYVLYSTFQILDQCLIMYAVTATLLNFVRMFRKAHEENCKQAELEKKKAQKEAAEMENAQGKSLKRKASKAERWIFFQWSTYHRRAFSFAEYWGCFRGNTEHEFLHRTKSRSGFFGFSATMKQVADLRCTYWIRDSFVKRRDIRGMCRSPHSFLRRCCLWVEL